MASTIMLVCLSPLMLAIAIAIRMDSRGRVLFKQERVGLNGKAFNLYKFRTMYEGAEQRTSGKYITEKDENLTRIGGFLRRFALDELPQLWNVLKGDMSIVGPRPTVRYQVEKYNERQWKRLEMKPGLTGWAQVNGRNKLTWPERIELDVWYVENWSLALDIKILLMTIPALLKKEVAFAGSDVEDDIVRLA